MAAIEIILDSDLVQLGVEVLSVLVCLISTLHSFSWLRITFLAVNLPVEGVKMVFGASSSAKVVHAVDCKWRYVQVITRLRIEKDVERG